MPSLPESRLFAVTPDGTRLPVIDLTNPAFAVPHSEAEIAAMTAAALAIEERRGPVRQWFIGLMLRLFARRSRLIAALQDARNTYLGGIATYVLKLGPDNLLPPYATDIDRQVAKTPVVVSMRLRLFEVATLLADALAEPLRAAPTAPIHILEIAGGPSADALNALLFLEKRGLLTGRQVRITVYDLDRDGPAFAASMLDALKTGPLAGRDVELVTRQGDWQDTAGLKTVVDAVPRDAILAATSEGGLFEYGSDTDIVGVLNVLAARVGIVTGSVTRDERLNQLMRRYSRTETKPRGLAVFGELVAPTGYRIARSMPGVLGDQVLLTRA
jgi:hypothetical protein